jgi:hypothetical protein
MGEQGVNSRHNQANYFSAEAPKRIYAHRFEPMQPAQTDAQVV